MTAQRATTQPSADVDPAVGAHRRGVLRFFAYLGAEGPIALLRGRAMARRASARARRRGAV